MSYTYNVKEEILNNEMITNIEKTAEISAVLLSKNAFYDDKIELRLENLALAKRVYKFIKDITSLKIEIKYQISKRLGEHNVYIIVIPRQKGYRDFTGMASADNVLKYNDLKINPKYRMVRNQGEDIKLTNYEFDILYLLAKRPGQVFSKEQIYSQVWKEPYYGAEDNVMSLIRRIRKKIEPDPSHPIYILTVWGMNSSWNYVNAISRKGNFLCSSCVT